MKRFIFFTILILFLPLLVVSAQEVPAGPPAINHVTFDATSMTTGTITLNKEARQLQSTGHFAGAVITACSGPACREALIGQQFLVTMDLKIVIDVISAGIIIDVIGAGVKGRASGSITHIGSERSIDWQARITGTVGSCSSASRTCDLQLVLYPDAESLARGGNVAVGMVLDGTLQLEGGQLSWQSIIPIEMEAGWTNGDFDANG